MTADAPTILATSAGFRRGPRGPYDVRVGPIHRFAAELAGDPVRLTGAIDAAADLVLDTADACAMMIR